jgi:hypothetical protein
MSPELVLAILALVGPLIAVLHWWDNHCQLRTLTGVHIALSSNFRLTASSEMLRERVGL